MKTDTKRLIALWVFAIICGILNSCGAKKSTNTESEELVKTELSDNSKNETVEQSTIILDTNVKKNENIVVDNQDKTTTIEETIEPIDPKLPASYTDKEGKRQSLDNTKKTTKSTTKNNNTKSKSEIKEEVLIQSKASSAKKNSDHKNIKDKAEVKKGNETSTLDRKAWSIWNFAWLLLAIPIYWIWKNRAKIIQKIWWV